MAFTVKTNTQKMLLRRDVVQIQKACNRLTKTLTSGKVSGDSVAQLAAFVDATRAKGDEWLPVIAAATAENARR